MDDWNVPRLALAVQRAGSLTGAARALGVDHSTVFRRLNALEARLGVRLFERLPGGAYQATPAGERMAAAAERMEDEALAVERDIAGRDHRLRSEEHTSELQSLMRISYAVFCLTKKQRHKTKRSNDMNSTD